MMKYTTVEDYLEVIAGLKDPATLKSNATNWFGDCTPIVNLARYDTDVLRSMSSAVQSGNALTEKQGELAVKIVLKYKRQLAAKGIDVTPVEEQVTWRLPLRKMDYVRKLAVDNDLLTVVFPFNNQLIEGLREFRKESQGHGAWDKEAKTWRFALTEYNLVWLTTWAQQNQFEIAPEVIELNKLISEVEATPYAIELQYENGAYTITNCPESLQAHIENNLGGFGQDNLARLVDMSSVLGYTVSKTIADSIVNATTPRQYALMTSRELKVDPANVTTNNLESVLDYADSVKRWPVIVYEPDLSGKLLAQLRELRPGQVMDVPRSVKHWDVALDSNKKYVHVVSPVTNRPIPLLISSAGMMYGGDKSLMVQNAEKIVYCAAEVYNKENHKVQTLAS